MSLISCPECGGKISDRAKMCPHCGFPIAGDLKEIRPAIMDDEQATKCPYCGANAVDDNNYCKECGMRIKGYASPPEEITEEKRKTIYKCLKCGEDLIRGEQNCHICGKIVPNESNLDEDMLYCPTCEGLNPLGSFICIHCGRKYSVKDMIVCVVKAVDTHYPVKIKVDIVNKDTAKCPRCGSTSITYINKKLSIGRAVVGGILFNGPGAILGGLSSKKGKAKCLKCGKEWKV